MNSNNVAKGSRFFRFLQQFFAIYKYLVAKFLFFSTFCFRVWDKLLYLHKFVSYGYILWNNRYCNCSINCHPSRFPR